MKSATAVSYELDDIAFATKELTDQIKSKLTFGKNTYAILHGQPDMEIGELAAAISKELGCHVMGGTAAAGATLTEGGYYELAVVLHVLSDDECLFATAISGSMATDPEKEIAETYEKAYQNLKAQDPEAKPEMVICVGTLLPNMACDTVLERVSSICGNLPVFGYIAGDDFEFSKQMVYLDDEEGSDRLAIALISGNVRPVFQTANLAGEKALEKRLVTKAHDNVICEIEGEPAYEYIKSFPFINDETTVLFNYQFFVEVPDDEFNDGIPVSRALSSFDKDSGEVTCFANVPENSYIGLLYCTGNDVAETSKTGISEFIEKLKNTDDYEYSTVLITTCSLRNMFLADMKDTEGNLVKEYFPPELSISGLYAFGEIAPTSIQEDGAVNRFHNATFTVCAF